MCNCIDEFNKMLIEKSNDPKASIKISFIVHRDTGKMDTEPAMYCTYRDKKKDGTFTKAKEHPISGEYCPFCGNKYDEEIK
jgi:hypothetical protein